MEKKKHERCESAWPAEQKSKLAAMDEVLALLQDGSCNFTDLEPIRHRYEQQFGDELCWSYPFVAGRYAGGVFLPVREGTLYLPYNGLDCENYEQFVLSDAHLMEQEEIRHLQQVLDHQYSTLKSGLETMQRHDITQVENRGYDPVERAYKTLTEIFCGNSMAFSDAMVAIEEAVGYLGEALGNGSDDLDDRESEKSTVEKILELIALYVKMQGYPVKNRLPINDLSRKLVQAMSEEQKTPVYLGSYDSDVLTPYTGQQIVNFQYNFCIPTDSKRLRKMLHDGFPDIAAFDRFYQTLRSLGGHILFWA